MASLEQQLTLLASRYGRYPYESPNGTGFAGRDGIPDFLFPTIEQAIAAEAKMVRNLVLLAQADIAKLDREINVLLTHLGILEV